MACLIFNEKGLKTGDVGSQEFTASALYNFQVFRGEVEIYGSNVPHADIKDLSQWQKLVTIGVGGDSEPYRQYAWNSIGYKIVSGDNVDLYVSVGVAG